MSAAAGTIVRRKRGEWVEIEEESSGDVYYFNKVTKAVSWEAPAGIFDDDVAAEVTQQLVAPSWLDVEEDDSEDDALVPPPANPYGKIPTEPPVEEERDVSYPLEDDVKAPEEPVRTASAEAGGPFGSMETEKVPAEPPVEEERDVSNPFEDDEKAPEEPVRTKPKLPPKPPPKPAVKPSNEPIKFVSDSNDDTNPFGGDSDSDDNNGANSVMKTSPTAPASASTVSNPFGDSSDDEEDPYIPIARAVGGFAISSDSEPTPTPTPVPAPKPAMVFNPPAKAPTPAAAAGNGNVRKEALRVLMITGVPQRFAEIILDEVGVENDLKRAMNKIAGELSTRPAQTDYQMWKQVLDARVGSWMPEINQGAEHTIYVITVTLQIPQYKTWQVSRRFREFKAVNKAIAAALKTPLPCEFPAHGWFSRDDANRRDERRLGAHKWLQGIVTHGHIFMNPLVKEIIWDFLDVEANRAKSASAKEAPQTAPDGRPLRKPSIR